MYTTTTSDALLRGKMILYYTAKNLYGGGYVSDKWLENSHLISYQFNNEFIILGAWGMTYQN